MNKELINEIKNFYRIANEKCINAIKEELKNETELALNSKYSVNAEYEHNRFSKIVRVRYNEETDTIQMTLDNFDYASDWEDGWVDAYGVNWLHLLEIISVS